MKTVNQAHFSRNGFTLIELLASTAIAAVLLIAVNSILFNAIRLKERANETHKELIQTIYAINVIKNDFLHAIPPNTDLGRTFNGKSVGGTMPISQVEFYTATGNTHHDEPYADIQKIIYSLQETKTYDRETKLYLVRSIIKNIYSTIDEVEKQELLLSNVQTFFVEFYDGDTWTNTWDSIAQTEPVLPEAVRLQIAYNSQNSRQEISQQIKRHILYIPINTESFSYTMNETDVESIDEEDDSSTEENLSNDQSLDENTRPNPPNNNPNRGGRQ